MNRVLLTVMGSLLAMSAFSQAERKYIRQGNKEYKEEEFEESEIFYRKALEKNESSFSGQFNLADALYKQEKYADAGKKFTELAGSENMDPETLGALYHNLGNSLLQDNKIRESIEAYKNALRNNPGDLETKHNLAYAQNMLQQQQQQQQQQNQNQDQQQENQDQQQQNQDQERQQKDEPEQQQNQEQHQQEQQPENDRQHQPDPQKISKEDAERILEALRQDEKEVQEKVQKQKAKAKRIKVVKDW